MRSDVFGDPLHSKPLVVNYGGDSEDEQEIRIIVGTNAGALHMFDDNGSSVDEAWAFMPKEFISDVKTLKDNFAVSSKVYGIDGPVTSYIYDANGDGKIDESKDSIWIFFGLRRGGNSYYALDITKKDAPELLWHIDGSGDFSGLGQTWSKPKVGYSALNIVDNVPKPVLFFGAGYSEGKDASGVGKEDSTGVGIYMVDAEGGGLLWSLSTAESSATNTYFSGTDSIPSPVAILDSDSNGLVDRVYAGDTGGNVWRVDMPGKSPNSATTPWTAFKLASVGGDTDATDRRFFYEPSIARTIITDTIETEVEDEEGNKTINVTKQERPYEAILLSSGDRTTPLSSDTDDVLL
jgi:type IV pilus assembly protein PilY1